MQRFDESVVLFFNSFAGRSESFDVLAASFTKLSPAIFLLLFGLCFFWPSAQQDAMRRNVLLSGTAGIVSVAVSLLLVALYYRPRPFVTLPPDQLRLIIEHTADSAFPSNHTIGAVALAAGMWRSPSKVARWTAAFVALFVGVSRLIVGVHWPTDVIGSSIMAIAITAGVFAAEPLLRPLFDLLLRPFTKKKSHGVG